MNAHRIRSSIRRDRRAFMLADVVMALVIVGVLGASMAVAVGRGRAASERVADGQAALATAEVALAEMTAGRKPSTADIVVEPADRADGASTDVPAGYTWVRIRATHNGRSADLTGLVPASSLPAPAAPQREGGSR